MSKVTVLKVFFFKLTFGNIVLTLSTDKYALTLGIMVELNLNSKITGHSLIDCTLSKEILKLFYIDSISC